MLYVLKSDARQTYAMTSKDDTDSVENAKKFVSKSQADTFKKNNLTADYSIIGIKKKEV